MSKRTSKRSRTKKPVFKKSGKLSKFAIDEVKDALVKRNMDLLEDDNARKRSYATVIAMLVERRTPEGALIRVPEDTVVGDLTEDKIIGFKITPDGKLTFGKVNDKGQLEPEIDKISEPLLLSLLELAKLQK